MPKILFASNNIAHWPSAVAGVGTETYDSARVPYSLAIPRGHTLNSPVFAESTTDESWLHFRLYTFGADKYSEFSLLDVYDEDNNLLLNLKNQNGTSDISLTGTTYNGDTSLSSDADYVASSGIMTDIDVKITIKTLLVEVIVYSNRFPIMTMTLNSNPNSWGKPVRCVLGGAFSNPTYISEIFMADGDTRNGRMNLLRPVSAGAHDAWTGQLTSLADDDPTTGMTTVDPDLRQSMIMAPYSGASNISNVVIVSSTVRGQNSPSKIQHSVSLAGVDYDGPAHDVDYTIGYELTNLGINPATSLPWSLSDFSSIETGFVSRA